MTITTRMVIAWIASAVVAATVIGAFVLLGSPGEQRTRRFDERRLADLRAASAAIDLHFPRHGTLPGSLDELPVELGPAPAARDPRTGAPYEYERLGADRYRLCATFARESQQERWGPERDFWAHGAGRQCFEIDAERVER